MYTLTRVGRPGRFLIIRNPQGPVTSPYKDQGLNRVTWPERGKGAEAKRGAGDGGGGGGGDGVSGHIPNAEDPAMFGDGVFRLSFDEFVVAFEAVTYVARTWADTATTPRRVGGRYPVRRCRRYRACVDRPGNVVWCDAGEGGGESGEEGGDGGGDDRVVEEDLSAMFGEMKVG